MKPSDIMLIVLFVLACAGSFYWGYQTGKPEALSSTPDSTYIKKQAKYDSLIRIQEDSIQAQKEALQRLEKLLNSVTLQNKHYAQKLKNMRSNPVRLPVSDLQSKLDSAGERLIQNGY